ncbi:uncharacterized protein LOC141660413 [Apium graveolens]|uniref:uncharacterized protein LOC141660413 n=1 Tax=Apium graveolens TaxID=4045 RepID=UPI003D7BD689
MTEAPLLDKPSPEDTLYLYLAVFEQALSAVLMKEEQKLQKHVYYIDLIKTHLETGWLLDDVQEARKLSVRALRYSLIEGLLYKRSFAIPYLKCLRPLEEEEALKEAHEGIYGQHLGGRSLAQKITQLGFYWPTILADAKAYVKKCDSFQRHAPIVRQPQRGLHLSTHPSFYNIGNGHTWTISCKFREYCDDNIIELCFTSIAYPQENGQAEVANRIILDGLKKRVERSRNTWVDELLPILWAYRTTWKVTTEATPFMLAYGAEAVVPLEITHGSPRVEAYKLEANEEGMRLALDLIDEI